MSELKLFFSGKVAENKYEKSVIALTSQVFISPYVLVADASSEIHKSTALVSADLLVNSYPVDIFS